MQSIIVTSILVSKKGGHNIYQKMLKEYKRLEKLSQKMKKEINTLPEGKLTICSNSESKSMWYNSDGKKRVYIPKKNRKLAEELAYKKYLNSNLEDITHEMRAIQFYLDHHRDDSTHQLISKSTEFQKLLSVNFTPLNEELNHWMNATYEKNKYYLEACIHKTCTGEMVRSKTEAYIYNCLCKYQIPFRYECELKLGNVIYYPDFTIRHPKTGELYYWEHFGRMDKPKYIHKTYTKLETYAHHGIVPFVNLITTYETKTNPMSWEMIDKIIEEYFL